ncbi:MAG: hypothetical protein HYY09_04045 [Firmicutes bacterium]|nr:hypothetical protein [Bacillota bacterium]
MWRGAAGGLLGLAHRMSGDLEAAGIYEQALELAAGRSEPMPPPAADLYVGMSELRREHDDLEAASRYLRRSKELSGQGWISEHRHRWYVVTARVKEAQGDSDRALDLLDEAERLYIRSPAPEVRPIPAVKARMWVGQGRLAEALGWVRERGLSVDDDLSYLREFEHITLVRVLIARSRTDRAGSSLRPIVDQAAARRAQSHPRSRPAVAVDAADRPRWRPR